MTNTEEMNHLDMSSRKLAVEGKIEEIRFKVRFENYRKIWGDSELNWKRVPNPRGRR